MSSRIAVQALFIALAIASSLVALLLSPENIMAAGFMRGSLTHANDLVRETALLEVAGLRVLAGIFAALCLAWAIFGTRIAATGWYRAMLARPSGLPPAYHAYQRRSVNASLLAILALTGLLGLYVVYGMGLLGRETTFLINREDGVIETVQALLILLAAILSATIAWRLPGRGPMVFMHAFLALLFFLMFGEEISWGQRIFGIETPEGMSAINVQNEINIHNSFGYLFDHLFILCFFLWGVAVPVLDAAAPVFRGLFRSIGLPVPSRGLAIGMLLATLIQPVLVQPLFAQMPTLRVAEARELVSALAFVLLMLEIRAFVTAPKAAVARRDAAPTQAGAQTPTQAGAQAGAR